MSQVDVQLACQGKQLSYYYQQSKQNQKRQSVQRVFITHFYRIASFFLLSHFYGISNPAIVVNEIAPMIIPSKKDNHSLFGLLKHLFLIYCLHLISCLSNFSYLFILNFLKRKLLCYQHIANYSILKSRGRENKTKEGVFFQRGRRETQIQVNMAKK